ncbi:MAG: amidohydrolase family protein [Lacisediminihabitans sp.]
MTKKLLISLTLFDRQPEEAMNTTDWNQLRGLPLTEWKPQSQLRLPATELLRGATHCIDVHNHLGRWLSNGEWMINNVDALLAMMDEHSVDAIVNLDGMWADEVTANVERYDHAHPGRFYTFCQLEWARLAEPDGVATLIASLDNSLSRGARGLKVWKNLGLNVLDADGSVILPDDPRVIEIIAHAGEIGLPVLIHTADPKAFFEPLDERNERLDELLQERDWWFGDASRYPQFSRLMDALHTLVLACPGTRFVGAHAGCAAEDLDLVESLLSRAPNFAIDIAGRMAELGRQPRRFAALVNRFPDRVLFGTDIYPIIGEQYSLHYRFLESADEAFDYSPENEIPPQGRWTVSGLALDPALLPAIYRGNAERFLGLV